MYLSKGSLEKYLQHNCYKLLLVKHDKLIQDFQQHNLNLGVKLYTYYVHILLKKIFCVKLKYILVTINVVNFQQTFARNNMLQKNEISNKITQ